MLNNSIFFPTQNIEVAQSFVETGRKGASSSTNTKNTQERILNENEELQNDKGIMIPKIDTLKSCTLSQLIAKNEKCL